MFLSFYLCWFHFPYENIITILILKLCLHTSTCSPNVLFSLVLLWSWFFFVGHWLRKKMLSTFSLCNKNLDRMCAFHSMFYYLLFESKMALYVLALWARLFFIAQRITDALSNCFTISNYPTKIRRESSVTLKLD